MSGRLDLRLCAMGRGLRVERWQGRVSGVIDWGGVTIADPELDLGAAVAIALTVPLAAPLPLRPIVRVAMRSLGRSFVRAYSRGCPVNAQSLRYFQVYTCLRQLIWVGLLAAAGDPQGGIYGSPEGVRNLVGHIRAVAGVSIDMPSYSRERNAIPLAGI